MLKEIVEACSKKNKHEDLLSESADYQKFFQDKLKKWGVKSPSELEKGKRKKFFNEIEKEWEGDNESD